MFIVALIVAAGLTSIKLTDANVAIQRKGYRIDETCECGKSITLSCTFKTNTYAIEWIYANDDIPIAKCLHQDCRLNPKFVEKYSISFDMTPGMFDLTVLKVTMELNGKMLVCSDGSNTAFYNISVRDYEPNLNEDRQSGTIKATSGCISHGTQVSFKWIKIYASSNIEMEFNPKSLVKSNTSCTNDSDCGDDMHVYYSEIIEAKASDVGKYYLKVTAIYGNESKESFSSNNSGQKYIIEDQDEEQLKSDSLHIALIVSSLFFLAAVCGGIFSVIVYRKKFQNSSSDERNEREDSLLSIQFQSMRNNLTFTNIPESINESTEESERLLRTFLVEKCQIAQSIVNEIKFERVHRMGQTQPDGPSDIVAEFSLSKDRETVRRSRFKLNQTGHFINEQYPKEICDRRRRLEPIMKAAIRDGKRAWITYDKLYINGKLVRDGDIGH